MTSPRENSKGALAQAPSRTILALAVAAVLVLVTVCSPASVVVIVAHLLPSMLIILAALGLGLALSALLLPKSAQIAWHFIGGAGLGLGFLSIMMLVLGTAGVMSRQLWLAILVVFAAGGLWRIIALIRAKSAVDESGESIRWLWMLVVPFAAIALLSASLPPGYLWPAEGNGYDVLEYHLAAPREFFEAGRILFLPHNIYSNFPFAVEMLYLLTMIVHGDPIAAGVSAQMIHLIMAGLAVAAIWLAGRQISRPAGIVASVLVATCPFVAYLCGLAYVENGLLLYAALALASVMRLLSDDYAALPRWALMTGLFGGLACGCKYTGIAVVLIPIAMPFIWRIVRSRSNRLASIACFAVGVLVSFGPWLCRNYINTGNPTFPLARSVFADNGLAWNDDGAARWAEGHLPAPEDRSIAGRIHRLKVEVLLSGWFGPIMALSLMTGIAQLIGWATRRQKRTPSTLPAWIMILVGVLAWLFFSHLVGRFAVTLIVPASIVLTSTWDSLRRREAKLLGIVVVVLSALFNLSVFIRACVGADLFRVAAIRAGDGTDWFTEGVWPTHAHVPRINKLTAEGHRVLIVADARRYYLNAGVDYCVVFDRNPFAEAAADLSAPELINWLREHRYDDVYVDWGEMARLRNSRYGFWDSIDRGLFERLTGAGLRHVEDFTLGEKSAVYSSLFEVP